MLCGLVAPNQQHDHDVLTNCVVKALVGTEVNFGLRHSFTDRTSMAEVPLGHCKLPRGNAPGYLFMAWTKAVFPTEKFLCWDDCVSAHAEFLGASLV